MIRVDANIIPTMIGCFGRLTGAMSIFNIHVMLLASYICI